MKWINFKKKVKDDLYEYESAGDGLDIWDSISGDVDALNAKNKKKDYTYLFLLLFLIGSLSAAYLVFQENKDTQEGNFETEIARTTEAINKYNIEHPTYPSTATVKQRNPGPGKSIPDVNNAKNTSENFTKIKDTSSASTKIKKRNTAKRSIITIARQNIKRSSAIKNADSSSPVNYNKKNNIEISTKKKVDLKDSKQVINSIIEHNKSVSRDKNSKGNAITDETAKNLIKESNKISTLTSNITSLNLKEFIIESSKAFPTKPILLDNNIETKVKPTNKFSIGVKVGVYYTLKQLSSKNSDGSSLVNARKNTERALETIHGGIYGAYAANSNLSFSLGLDYNRINEAFSFVETLQETQIINGIKYVFTGSGVNPTRLDEMGEIIKNTTTTTDYTLYNKYELIDIPLLISYKWNKNKWSYGIQTGIIANLNFKESGRILASETNSETISTQDIFKKSLGISYSINLVIEHRLHNSIGITFSPSLRYFPNSFTKDSYLLTQKYQLIGGNVGLKYYFRNN